MTLTDYFGTTPRVRILEAILRLAPYESFTMKEVAQEADLFPPSTYRTIRRLVDDGFLEVAESGRPERFRVPHRSPDVQLLSLIEAAITQLRSPIQLRKPNAVTDRFKRLAAATTNGQVSANNASSQRMQVSHGVVRQDRSTAV